MSNLETRRSSEDPNFIQPPWQPSQEKLTPSHSALPCGWMGQVMSKTPVQQAKTKTFNENAQKILVDGPTFYAFKEAYPNVNFGQFGQPEQDQDGKPVCHLYQQALNPWVQTEDGKQHPMVLMRSTQPITEVEMDMLQDDLITYEEFLDRVECAENFYLQK